MKEEFVGFCYNLTAHCTCCQIDICVKLIVEYRINLHALFLITRFRGEGSLHMYRKYISLTITHSFSKSTKKFQMVREF